MTNNPAPETAMTLTILTALAVLTPLAAAGSLVALVVIRRAMSVRAK